MNIENVIENLKNKNVGQPEFIQAVTEVLETIEDVYNQHPQFDAINLIDRITEPDRTLIFKIPWMDDKGKVHVSRGFRVEFNNVLGPYKGGLRFHPSVTLGSLKFLAFEQTFKNALTGLPLGGGKGGADFNPKGKSDTEIMRFCQAFMLELHNIIGPDTDVPAGDIGVGGRELGFLYGMYKKLSRKNDGALTGKSSNWGGSLLRPEATGYGGIYFVNEMLAAKGDSIKGKTICISGFGNVAWGAVSKATELGAKVITISGPDGYIYDPDGFSDEKIEYLLDLRASNNDVVEPYAKEFDVAFCKGKKPWEQPCDIAMPCAIQNELNEDDAQFLVKNKVKLVAELSNMGCTAPAIDVFTQNHIPFAPGKAANAGGVSVSGLEMTQNAMKLQWTAEEVDAKLHHIMKQIHLQCLKYGREDGYTNYVKGANIAGFLKVAYAMIDQGVV